MDYDYYDSKFGGMSKGAQVILLLIPFINIIAELVLRVEICVKKRSVGWIIGEVIMIICSGTYIVCVIDALFTIAGKPLLVP